MGGFFPTIFFSINGQSKWETAGVEYEWHIFIVKLNNSGHALFENKLNIEIIANNENNTNSNQFS